jgi:hypothetical protein
MRERVPAAWRREKWKKAKREVEELRVDDQKLVLVDDQKFDTSLSELTSNGCPSTRESSRLFRGYLMPLGPRQHFVLVPPKGIWTWPAGLTPAHPPSSPVRVF